MSPSRGVSKGAMHLSWSLLSCLLLLCLPTILLAAAQDCDSRSPGSEGVSSCNRDEERKEPFLGAQAPMENKYKMDSNAEMSSTTIQSASSKDASPSSTLSPKQNVPAPSTPKLSVDKQSIKPSGKPSIPKKQPHTERKSEKKDPFNYASFDCGALILASNPEAKEVSAILVNSKDRYMLNRCGTRHKWFEIEFCEEILVESISLANYELFSSTFKEFKVFVNNRYPSSPSHPWQLLGTFTSRNVRGKQVFPIDSPVLWAKYLRIEFVTHYGNEFYCPFSQIKVFGTTMMEEVKAEEQKITPKMEIKVPTPPRVWLPTLDSPKFKIQPSLNLDVLKREQGGDEEDGRTVCPNIASESVAFLGDPAGRCQIFKSSPQSSLNGKMYAPPRLQPGKVQESIFKNIIKRLALLEESATYTLAFLKEQEKALRKFMDSTRQEQEDILFKFMEDQWSDEILKTLRLRLEYTVRHIEYQQSIVEERLEKLDSMMTRLHDEFYAYHMLWQIPLALALFALKFIYNNFTRQQQEEPRRPVFLPVKQESPLTPTPSPLQIPERRISMKDVSFVGRIDSPVYLRKKRKRKTYFVRETFPARLSVSKTPPSKAEESFE